MKPDTFFCANCGAQNYPMSEEATALFNDNQQTVINSYTEPQTVLTNPGQWNSSQPQQQPPQKKVNTGLIVAVIVMAVIIIAGIAAIIGYSVGHKDDTADTKQPETTTESDTQSVEVIVQQETTTDTTTAAPTTEAVRTTAPVTNQQAVPTFTYNDNNSQSSQFLFDSANQYITRSYLSTCTRDEITIILNEMYARHGYIFKDAELRAYFNSQSWYTGYITSMEEAASYFNSVESANLNTIYEYMKDMGWRQ
ncbi:MAG: YARHG domain-containing protein [Clostridia bacterium]|nr:YARHG domain-containing protein [Clostridia bacterium]